MKVEHAVHGSSRYTGEVGPKGRDGYGIMKYANGEAYVGEWRNGRREGEGVYFYSDGTVYDGAWGADKAHGVGMCRYPTGNVYHGEWLVGRVSGRGTMFYSDGDTYDGEWREGHLHGRGKFYNKSGDVYEGRWYEDQVMDDDSPSVAPMGQEVSPTAAANLANVERKRQQVEQRCAHLTVCADRIGEYMSLQTLEEVRTALHARQAAQVLQDQLFLQTPMSHQTSTLDSPSPLTNGGGTTATRNHVHTGSHSRGYATAATAVATSPATAGVMAAAAPHLLPPPSHSELLAGANGVGGGRRKQQHPQQHWDPNPLTSLSAADGLNGHADADADVGPMLYSPASATEPSPTPMKDRMHTTFDPEASASATARTDRDAGSLPAVAVEKVRGGDATPSLPTSGLASPDTVGASATPQSLTPGGGGARRQGVDGVFRATPCASDMSSIVGDTPSGSPLTRPRDERRGTASDAAGHPAAEARASESRMVRGSRLRASSRMQGASSGSLHAQHAGGGSGSAWGRGSMRKDSAVQNRSFIIKGQHRKRMSASDEEGLEGTTVGERGATRTLWRIGPGARVLPNNDIEIDLDADDESPPAGGDWPAHRDIPRGHSQDATVNLLKSVEHSLMARDMYASQSASSIGDDDSVSSHSSSSLSRLESVPDEGEREEQYKKLKAMFDRLQADHAARGDTLTNADVRNFLVNDRDVQELTRELPKETVKGWFKTMTREDPERQAEFDSLYLSQQELERSYRDRRIERRSFVKTRQQQQQLQVQQQQPLSPPLSPDNTSFGRFNAIEIEAMSVTLRVSGPKLGNCARTMAWCALLPFRKQQLHAVQLKTQRRAEVERRKSRHGQDGDRTNDDGGSADGRTDDGSHEYSGGGAAFGRDEDSGSSDHSPTFRLWTRLRPLATNTFNKIQSTVQRIRKPPPPHGSTERAKGMETVFALCGPGREQFSLARFASVFSMMFFPFPFAPCCTWAPDTTDQERQYVVSGAEPRYLERPGQDILMGFVVVPLIIVMIVYSSSESIGDVPERDALLAPADLAIPIVCYVLLALSSAAFTAYPRRKAHYLETLPDAQYNLLAKFTYCMLKPKIGGDWAVAWCVPPEETKEPNRHSLGGDFIRNPSNKHTAISAVAALAFALAMPIHRLVEEDSMWGDTRGARVVTGLGAAVTVLSLFALFQLLTRVLRMQQQLVDQLRELTNMTEVACEQDVSLSVAVNKFTFNLSNTGLTDSLFRPTRESHLQTLLGWYICRSFVLYGSPVMNHNGHTAVMNVQVFLLVAVSLALCVVFIYDTYDGTGGRAPTLSNRAYTVATLCLVVFAPLVAIYMRLWYRVSYFYKQHHTLLSSAATAKRVKVVREDAERQAADGHFSHEQEAHLVKGLADFVRDNDYKPRLGSRSLLLFLLLLVLAMASLVARWTEELRGDDPIDANATGTPVAPV